jgi:pimeloyl-ACP methyl ester carboxylesterase
MRAQADGITLQVDDRGTGFPVLLIHGFPLDRTLWRHQMKDLHGYRLIAPDLRGMGATEAPGGSWTMGSYAGDLVALLDRLGVERAVVVGLSMGGYIAFELIRHWPERVAGLVLMDTRPEADSEEARAGRDRMIADVRVRGAAAVADVMMPRLVGATTAAIRPAWLDELRAQLLRTPVAGIIGALEAMKARPDSTPLLAGVSIPALVMVGAEDVLTPAAVSERMAATVPGAELALIPHAGHLPPLEQPEAVTTALARFLGGRQW